MYLKFPTGLFILFSVILLIFGGCSGFGDYSQTQKWELIYQNDFNGQPVSGSIEDLVIAMKKGSPIRVSWGGTEDDGSSWIEFAEPVFTTVMNDTAVVVQFPLSFIQTHYTDPNQAYLRTDPPSGWRAIMSTTGRYHQFHYDLESGRITKELFARTNMHWYALRSPEDNRTIPDLTPRNAFKLDSLIEK